jgi:hypothetical protein
MKVVVVSVLHWLNCILQLARARGTCLLLCDVQHGQAVSDSL